MFKLFNRKQKIAQKQEPKIETVNDLLANDDVSGTLMEVNNLKSNIDHVVIIYQTKDGFINYQSSNLDNLQLYGLLEFAKSMISTDGGD
jgi:intein/homing endonuclease